MKLGSTFSVPAKRTKVFERFFDPDTMRQCIPGCEELVRLDENHYSGRLTNEIAHVRFAAAFSLEIVDVDPPRAVRAVLQGEDNRLASSLKLDANLLLEADGDERSTVTYQMDLAMWGKLGRLGESIFRRRTADVEREFVERFAAACSSGAPAVEPVPGHPAGRGHVAGEPAGGQPAHGEVGLRVARAESEPVGLTSTRQRPWWRRLAGWFTQLVGRR